MPTSTISDLLPGKLFIGADWRDAASGETIDTLNPATGERLTTLAEAGPADVGAAVDAARQAFESKPWATMAAADRGRLLTKLAGLVERDLEKLACLETLDNGKPIFESRYVDLPAIVDIFHYYAGWATKLHGETIPVRGPYLNYTLREPVGVVGAIVPWNFPLLLASWKLGPALAAGNTVVLKPAEQTSLTALALAELTREAGFPPGVINVVTGRGRVTGAALAGHPGVDKIAFTGSTETGKSVMRAGVDTLKRVTLELGGKSPNIVLQDADLENAVKGAYNGIFYGKGEVCAAGSRLFVHRKVHDAFLEKLVERTKKLVPADPMDPKTRLGALVSAEQMRKVLEYVEIGKSEGARLAAGGGRVEVGNGKGYFVAPTVFDGVKNDSRLAREEIFGHVLATLVFDDLEEVVRASNDNPYGLAAAVWTRDIAKAHNLAARLKAGTVWINCYNAYDAAAPFGGVKASGFGRDLGMHALEAYTQTKDVWVNLKD
ncbi:MAG: aldehyde dehydrogenase family protein [Candidatus Wallbacteria bacterium]|nr:aldehyde dehydrogenase family protein [Candidatus Wallbacteria bacterium]